MKVLTLFQIYLKKPLGKLLRQSQSKLMSTITKKIRFL